MTLPNDTPDTVSTDHDVAPAIGFEFLPRKRGRPKASDTESINAQVLTAARDEFWEVGFMAASMEAIAARAQISKHTVYNRYPNKTEIFKAYIRSELDLWTQGNEKNPEIFEATSLEHAIRYHISTQIKAANTPEIRNLTTLLLSSLDTFPELARYQTESSYKGLIMDPANDIRKFAEMDGVPCRDPEAAAELLRSIVSGVMLMNRMAGKEENEDHLAVRLTEVVLATRSTW